MNIKKVPMILYKIFFLLTVIIFISYSYSIYKQSKNYDEEIRRINEIKKQFIKIVSSENYYLNKKNLKSINFIIHTYKEMNGLYKKLDFSSSSRKKKYYYNEIFEIISKHKESFMRAIYYQEKKSDLNRVLLEIEKDEVIKNKNKLNSKIKKELDLTYIEGYQLEKSMNIFEKQNITFNKNINKLKEYCLLEKREKIIKTENKFMIVTLILILWIIILIKMKLYKIYYKGDENGYKIKEN